MAILIYATGAEYATWLGVATPPDGATRLLRGASLAIAGPLATATYDVDADGYPTDPDLLAALRDATCAQADHMTAVGDTTGTGVTMSIKSGSIGSLSVTRTVTATGAKDGVVPELGAAARRILLGTGLQFGTVADLYQQA